MGAAVPDFKALATALLRYDTATVKAERILIMAKDRLNTCIVRIEVVPA